MRFEAVLFDCDGVLVDSEPIVNRILRDMLAERGWQLSQAECMRIFVGKMVRDERARIERETGQPLTEEWLAAFRARRNAALEQELCIVPGAQAAVHAVHERLARVQTTGPAAAAQTEVRPLALVGAEVVITPFYDAESLRQKVEATA
jgi:beta-phosphoglucomutase-like phosphatase (HAD superfamily)